MTEMTDAAVRRIQSHADRTGTNQDLKARVQSAVAKKRWKEMIMIDHQSDLDNHSDQLNPNNDEYRGD